MLLDSDGKLLKPIQAPPRGEREVEFYQTVFGCETSDQSILRLRQFVPTFHGVKHVVFPGLPFKDILDYVLVTSDSVVGGIKCLSNGISFSHEGQNLPFYS